MDELKVWSEEIRVPLKNISLMVDEVIQSIGNVGSKVNVETMFLLFATVEA
jgi:hypothetical protein